jgi:osmotically-inducible protein OsmY
MELPSGDSTPMRPPVLSPGTRLVRSGVLVIALLIGRGCKMVRPYFPIDEDALSTPHEYLVDAGTTQRVILALRREPSLQGFTFDLETVDGVVELHGFVDTEAQMTTAGQVAARVARVKGVENDITVR